jgi:methionyl-tRNA formyltransferase
MKLVFCGTPTFAVPTLEALIKAGHEIALVVSQPDRPVGRSQELTPPPVKQTALAHSLPIAQPEKIRDNEEFQRQLEAIAPEAIIVVAYGHILPSWMLKLPRYGCINLHASLLPKYRGAAPIQWAVANGDKGTGNTTMLLDEGMDTGPVLLHQGIHISRGKSSVDIYETMAMVGAPLVIETLKGLANGTVVPKPQNEALATYAPPLKREDARMDFAKYSARQLVNRWLGFQPWPGAFTELNGKKLIVHNMDVAPGMDGEPGEVRIKDDRLFVACYMGWLEFLEVQPEGKKRMKVADFLRGNPLKTGDRLG